MSVSCEGFYYGSEYQKGCRDDTAKIGQNTGILGAIKQEKSEKGTTAGWGKLKNGARWISLDYYTLLYTLGLRSQSFDFVDFFLLHKETEYHSERQNGIIVK